METKHAEQHLLIQPILLNIANNAADIHEAEKLLIKNGIGYELIRLLNCIQILIFTGSSGYDIVGYSLTQYNNSTKIKLEEIYN